MEARRDEYSAIGATLPQLDDVRGWIEDKSGDVTRHDSILERLRVSRSECDAIILHARIKAGWIE
jgi:N utilization substance protein A